MKNITIDGINTPCVVCQNCNKVIGILNQQDLTPILESLTQINNVLSNIATLKNDITKSQKTDVEVMREGIDIVRNF